MGEAGGSQTSVLFQMAVWRCAAAIPALPRCTNAFAWRSSRMSTEQSASRRTLKEATLECYSRTQKQGRHQVSIFPLIFTNPSSGSMTPNLGTFLLYVLSIRFNTVITVCLCLNRGENRMKRNDTHFVEERYICSWPFFSKADQ